MYTKKLSQKIIAAALLLSLLLSASGCSGGGASSAKGYSGHVKLSASAAEDGSFALAIEECTDDPGIGGLAAQRLVDEMNARQSLAVDVISGATATSAATIESAESALKKAGFDTDELKERADFSNIEQRSMDCDVLVVGAGGAGLTAAIAAAERGAKVIILEKMGIAGGTTARSYGQIMASGSTIQLQNLVKDSSASFASFLYGFASSRIDSGRLVDLAEHSAANLNRLLKYNVSFSGEVYPAYDGQEPARNHLVTGNGASGGGYLIKPLLDAAEALGVEIIYNADVYELVFTATFKVTGARARDKNGSVITVNALSTVLATGGYANSEALLRELGRTDADDVVSMAALGSTGDGVELARSVGGLVMGGSPIAELCDYYGDTNGKYGLLVTPYGERFCDESGPAFFVSGALYEKGYSRAYYITTDGSGLADAVEAGDVIKAGSIAELAKKLGASRLEATVKRYNSLCENKDDADFGKSANYLKAINAGASEFYAVPYISKVYGTTGGVVTNIGCSVLSDYGPIEGLYAAGELINGSYFDGRFPGFGASLAEVVETGRVAGTRAAIHVGDEDESYVDKLTQEYYQELLALLRKKSGYYYYY